MANFFTLWQEMNDMQPSMGGSGSPDPLQGADPASGAGESPMPDESANRSKAEEAIRAGLDISDDFWDNFISVCNNSDALSELLGVDSQKISTWSEKIKQAVDQVKSADGHDSQEKGEMLPTGAPSDDMNSSGMPGGSMGTNSEPVGGQ